MFGAKQRFAIIIGFLFMIPAERIAPVFGCLFVKPDHAEHAAAGLDPLLCSALPLVGDNSHGVAGGLERTLKRSVYDLFVGRAVMRQVDVSGVGLVTL